MKRKEEISYAQVALKGLKEFGVPIHLQQCIQKWSR